MSFSKVKFFYVCVAILLIVTGLAGNDGENRSVITAGEKVVFSEVLYDSPISGESYGEWIELYNPQYNAVDIGGWSLVDNSGTCRIPSGSMINAHGFLIITNNASYFQVQYGCMPNIIMDMPKLANDGDFLKLINKSGITIDTVAWKTGGSSIPGWGSTSQPYADNNKSIQRKNLYTDTNTYTDWESNCTPEPVCGGSGGTPQPVIVLSKSSLEFNIDSSGTANPQTFKITNGGSGTLSCSISTSATWLKCSPTNGTDGTVITVSVQTTGLSNGTHTGTISVSDPNASNSPQTVAVALIVNLGGGTPQPVIVLSKSSLEFNLDSSGTANPQTFYITNGGSGTLSCSISTSAIWLKCSPATGTDGTVITVSVQATGLGNGAYTGTISVSDPNASNSPQTITVTLIVNSGGGNPQPVIVVSKSSLYFTIISNGTVGNQEFTITNGGSGTLSCSISTSATWLKCSPTTGTDGTVITVSVQTTGLSNGTHTGTISVSDPNASNSPQAVAVTLNLLLTDSPPFGEFATPLDYSYVSGSIPVTGWALDDVAIESLKIYRNENNTSSYIGDAVFVEGARPDIQDAYPGYPNNHKAGWGYMMLTHFLPNNGNGTFVLEARVKDISGKEVSLGTKTIYCDNANAVKPFGAIDTPTQGGTASGAGYRNVGWVLTPMPNMIPTDGSTIFVYVDAVKRGNVNYNIYREDIAGYFPGYANSSGAAGYFDLDTTAYVDGLHTISWAAVDNAGNAEGIGSRYFSIQNNGGRVNSSWLPDSHQTPNPGGILDIDDIPVEYSFPVHIKKGYNQNAEALEVFPNAGGSEDIVTVEIEELERIEIVLGTQYDDHATRANLENTSPVEWIGFRILGNQVCSLPIGSTFDTENGVFYWQPGPGFVGCYEFVFIKYHPQGPMKKTIEITIRPRLFMD